MKKIIVMAASLLMVAATTGELTAQGTNSRSSSIAGGYGGALGGSVGGGHGGRQITATEVAAENFNAFTFRGRGYTLRINYREILDDFASASPVPGRGPSVGVVDRDGYRRAPQSQEMLEIGIENTGSESITVGEALKEALGPAVVSRMLKVGHLTRADLERVLPGSGM